jgi:hypothetical protein
MEIEILDKQACRMCLEETNALLISLSKPHNGERNLAGLIKCVSGLPVDENDVFPQFICVPCLEELEAAYKVKMRCLKSDEKLRIKMFDDQSEYQKREEEEAPFQSFNCVLCKMIFETNLELETHVSTHFVLNDEENAELFEFEESYDFEFDDIHLEEIVVDDLETTALKEPVAAKKAKEPEHCLPKTAQESLVTTPVISKHPSIRRRINSRFCEICKTVLSGYVFKNHIRDKKGRTIAQMR